MKGSAVAPGATRTSVLVVEDSTVDRRLVGTLLEKDTEHEVLYAENGVEALHMVRSDVPNVVVTDLRMPEMNGLELVVALKVEFPEIPVVLVTAHGSEKIAVRALRAGAASYVPKRLLAAELVPTVDEVMQVASEGKDQVRVLGHLRRNELLFVLENDETLFSPLVHYVQELVSQTRLCDATQTLQVGVALDEALHNAMIHGNLEIGSELRETDPRGFWKLVDERKIGSPYRHRRIFVEIALSRQEVAITLRDQGRGFDHTSLRDPTDPVNLDRVSGRGIFLMRTFMDDVDFNEAGNEVTLIKRAATHHPVLEADLPQKSPG